MIDLRLPLAPNGFRSMARLSIGDGRCLPWVMTVNLSSLGIIFAADYYFEISSPDLLVVAFLDEFAHLATTTIVLLGFWRVLDLWFAGACLAATVLIDIDHLPSMLSADGLTLPAERPVTHSILWVAVLLLLATVVSGRWRAILLGLTLGIAAHLFRDIVGGIPLVWPASGENFEVSYWAYGLSIGLVALLPLARFLITRRHARQ